MFWTSGSIPHPPLLPSSPSPRFAPPFRRITRRTISSPNFARIEIFSRCCYSKSIFGEVCFGGSIRDCLEGWLEGFVSMDHENHCDLFSFSIFPFLGGGMDWLERMKSVTVTISSKQFYSGRVTHERRAHEGDM